VNDKQAQAQAQAQAGDADGSRPSADGADPAPRTSYPAPSVPFRSGYVAIVGLPNAGKSTLVNRLLGRHLAITSPKPQTTRHRILGILNGPDFQALLLDTPGVLKPGYRLQEHMEKQIDSALGDADVLVLVLDATEPARLEELLCRVSRRPAIAALNKVDSVEKPALLPLAAGLAERGISQVFMVSALRGSGVDELKEAIVAALPEGPPLYPQDMVADREERFFAAELVREAVFRRFGAEVPYAVTVGIDEFLERPGRKDFIRATIYVERESQKPILIGRDGRALKKVGSAARRSIEQFLGRSVYLELWVKVAENWRRDDRFLKENVYPDQG